MVEVRTYDPATDAGAWDAFVDSTLAAHVLFRRGYMDYHADRFADASQIVRRTGSIVALLPASREGDVVTSHGGLTFGGLQLDGRSGAAATLEILEGVLAALARAGARRLVYKAVPQIYLREPAEQELYALFRSGAVLERRDIAATIRLDAQPGPSKTRRYEIRRALAAGVSVEQSDEWDAFMAIECETLARHGVAPVHSAGELRLLAGRFPGAITLTVARHEGSIVAGVVLYTTARVAHAQYIGATATGRALGATDAIVDALVTREAAAGRAYFDFGISTVDAGRTLNEGLAAYKESFGAGGVAYDTYGLTL